MNRTSLVGIALLAVLSVSCAKSAVPSSNATAQPLECRITPLAASPTSILFSLTNSSAGPLWVLRWNTPLEGSKGTVLTVTRDGAELPYQGPMLKRADPGEGDYVKIAPGETAAAPIDLAQIYEMTQPGKYQVTVTGSLIDVTKDGASVPRPRDQHEAVELRCEGVTLEVKAGS